MSLDLSDRLAVIAGKASARAIRALGAGLGSNLPGRVALAVSSNLLLHLAGQARAGVICVSGTNGKSTTAGLISSIFTKAGYKLAHNRQGANLVPGITASLVETADWSGRLDVDYCLFETDEAALPLVAKQVTVGTVVVTNLFRDQLDRFGELDTTASLIKKGIGVSNSRSVLNADDPNVAQLAGGGSTLYYGIQSLEKVADAGCETDLPSDVAANVTELSYCPKCGCEYRFAERFYGQLGHYLCEKCGNKRPEPDVFADRVAVSPTESTFVLRHKDLSLQVRIALPGLFNVYNAVAAAALAFSAGINIDSIVGGLEGYSTLFGRSERLKLSGKTVLIQLIKNPAGASQAVRAAAADPNARILVAINDNYADGRDVSWLWDAEFDVLSTHKKTMFVSGCRAADMAVRLKYGGVAAPNIKVNAELGEALREALSATAAGETLWILPTYTCLLELQKIVRALGVALSGT